MLVLKKHIPHQSSQSISRDVCSDESRARREPESVYVASSPFRAARSSRHGRREKLLALARQSVHCSVAVRCGEDCQGQIRSATCSTIAAEQSRAGPSEVTRLCLDTGSFSSEWLRGTGCKDNTHTHTHNLISFSVIKSAEVCAPFFLCLALSFFFWRSSQRSRITERAFPVLSHASVT